MFLQKKENMFCSTIIPTIGRPSLSRSVMSLLRQDFSADKFEIIVVNDSGRPLEPAAWQREAKVQILTTNMHDKSIARNVGAAIAQGEYLHFLDDDDWMLPGAFSDFWRVAKENKEATLIYGSAQLFDRKGRPLCQLQHNWISDNNWIIPILTGEWMATESYMIKAKTFFEVGGYNPLMPTFEERDLCRRVALKGDFAGTSSVISSHYMGEENSTTDFSRGDLDNQRSRETMLNEGGAFSKMIASAPDGYWHGRIIRGYLSSLIWNIKQKNLLMAASRAFYGFFGGVLAGRYLLTRKFWDAITKPYISNSYIYEDDPRFVKPVVNFQDLKPN